MRAFWVVLALSFGGSALAQERLSVPLPVDAFPNFVAIGIGGVPDYMGSDDYFYGATPAVNLDLGQMRFKMLGNWAMLDFFNTSNWSIGPAAVLRFGRNDVDDAVVSLMSEVDNTIELGVSVGYEFVDSENPLQRISVGVDLLHDVGGVHNGFVVNAFARSVYPLPWRGGALVGVVGATYVGDQYADTYFGVSPSDSAASGLPQFTASSGARDLRAGIGVFQSLSLNWHVGAGMMYGRMLGDAGSSPIVDDRGSRNQFIFGLGVAYTWGGILAEQ